MANLPALPPLSAQTVTGDALRLFMQVFARDWLKRYVEDVLNIYEGEGVPSADVPDGSLYRRRDTGELYVRESGVWVAK